VGGWELGEGGGDRSYLPLFFRAQHGFKGGERWACQKKAPGPSVAQVEQHRDRREYHKKNVREGREGGNIRGRSFFLFLCVFKEEIVSSTRHYGAPSELMVGESHVVEKNFQVISHQTKKGRPTQEIPNPISMAAAGDHHFQKKKIQHCQ